MPSLNAKPVRLLMRDMVDGLELRLGHEFTREQAVAWFAQHYPNVKEGTVTAHLIRQSTNTETRLHYHPRADGSDDLFVKLDAHRFRVYDPGSDPPPIRERATGGREGRPEQEGEEEELASGSAFAYERDLREYLARNLALLEPGLRLYEEEGITGVEFPAGSRFIDILALDRDQNYVVIELKVSRGYDRTVGQLLRYMGWIERHHAEPGQRVRGTIVAREITEDLRLACVRLADVQLYEYALSVTLTRAVD